MNTQLKRYLARISESSGNLLVFQMLRCSYTPETSFGKNTDPVAQVLALCNAVRGQNYATLILRHSRYRFGDQLLRGRIHATEQGKKLKHEFEIF